MLKKNNSIKMNKQGSLLLQAVLKYGFVFLFGFFFFIGQSSTLANNKGEESIVIKETTCRLSEDLFNRSHSPLHLPFESTPTQDENDTPDENELEDDYNDNNSSFTIGYTAALSFNFSVSLKSCFIQTTQSFQNRSRVPLFILYHSWKSFLS